MTPPKPRSSLITSLAASVCVCLVTSAPLLAGEHSGKDIPALLARADELHLADRREWHLLLHYRPNLFGGYTSEQDEPSFFLSPDGKTDPAAELSATIRQFFSDDPVGRSKQPGRCAFIARYSWLREQLPTENGVLPEPACERFQQWSEELKAESITLIFASAFLNNPASTFGHTFLRIDQKGQTDSTRLLAYTINYAADVPQGTGPLYPIKGIFGGFKGYLSTPPYYLKVQEYRDIDNRDIWEYRLNLTEAQLQRLLMHAWELGNASFDYFFFKENCSYHLLALLDYADPSLHLTDHFVIWTVPADTVRLIASKPGLVSQVVYRPSRANVIRRKRESLSSIDQALAHRLTQESAALTEPSFVALPVLKQTFLLDLASDYLRYRIDTAKEPVQEWKDQNRRLLAARSQLRVPSELFMVEPFAQRPDLGHDTSRAGVGAGWRNNDTFEEVAVRAGYHDLLDPEVGHTPDAQIELASLVLRHYNRADQTRIERATLANVLSLSPIDRIFHAPSWKFNVGIETIRNRGCQLCSNGVANGGVGGAVESHWIRREVFFAFAEAEANYSRAYEERHRIGGGGTAGGLVDLTERWRLLASASYLKYAFGEKSDDVRWFVGQRLTISRNWAVRLEYQHRDHDNDVLFTIQAFF